MLILLSLIFLSYSLPVLTKDSQLNIISIQHYQGPLFYVTTPEGLYLYNIQTNRIEQNYPSQYGNIVGVGYLNMPTRAIVPTTRGIVQYEMINQVINQKYIPGEFSEVYYSNGYVYAITRKGERESDVITIFNSGLNKINELSLGKIDDLYVAGYVAVKIGDVLYILQGNNTVKIDDLKTSSMFWYGKSKIYIPFYQQLYVINLQGDVIDVRYFNSSILSVFDTENEYAVHTIDGIYIGDKKLDIEPPTVKKRKYLSNEMAFVNDGKYSYMIYNGIPVGVYEFQIANNLVYIPSQRLFVTNANTTILAYSSDSCYFYKRAYIDYCRDIEIEYTYFGTAPSIWVNNESVPLEAGKAMVRWGKLSPKTYKLTCISPYQGNYLVGQSDTVDLVILPKGRLNEFVFNVYHDNNKVDNYYITQNGTVLRFEVANYRNQSIQANIETYLFDRLLENGTIFKTRSIQFDEPGDYRIRIYERCHQPIDYYVRIVKQEGIPWILILVGLLVVVIIFIVLKR